MLEEIAYLEKCYKRPACDKEKEVALFPWSDAEAHEKFLMVKLQRMTGPYIHPG